MISFSTLLKVAIVALFIQIPTWLDQRDTKVLLNETFSALAPNGFLIIYGPFMRNGKLTSKGDIDFHTSIRKRNNTLGYKNDVSLLKLVSKLGFLNVKTIEMPANNLGFIIQKTSNY